MSCNRPANLFSQIMVIQKCMPVGLFTSLTYCRQIVRKIFKVKTLILPRRKCCICVEAKCTSVTAYSLCFTKQSIACL